MHEAQIITEKNVSCSMRDGVKLRADIYRPNQPGNFPVLLTRLPYGKDDPHFSHRYLDTNRLVLAGYIVIIQDVRGRFQSKGDFFPFQNEAEDGYETVEWAAQLPYADGRVGMFGLSYYGFTQLLAAKEQPPHLEAIFPAMTLNDLRTNMVYQNGVPKLASMKTWILESMVPDLLKRKYGEQPELLQNKMAVWAKAMDELPESYHQTLEDGWPLLDELGVAKDFYQVYDYTENHELWQQASILDAYEKMNIPALHLAGWYDSLLQSTIDNFSEMTKANNACQRLIIGPWTHGNFNSMQAERDFGLQASEHFLEGIEDLTNLHIRWFDHWLKNESTDVEREAPVKLFVMGINQWRDEDAWPLERTDYTPYYLHSGGTANSRFGDGKLLTDVSEKEAYTDTFIHEPKNPVPTTGGQTMYRDVQIPGPKNQRTVEERGDVLVYTTDQLDKALEVTGPVTVKLWAASQAAETTFTAKLVDVFPDGTAYNLTDGIAQITTSNSDGEATYIEIDLWATSNVFLPGHAVRIEIASSNHPQFECANAYDSNGELLTKVEQTIYHDTNRPSHILLPIIE